MRSAWTQTGGPDHSGTRSAASHAAVTASVSTTPQVRKRGAGVRILRCQRPAAVGSRPIRQVDPLQRRDERRQVGCQHIGVSDVVDRWVLAIEPAVHRPRQEIALGRQPRAEHDRDGNRQAPACPHALGGALPAVLLCAQFTDKELTLRTQTRAGARPTPAQPGRHRQGPGLGHLRGRSRAALGQPAGTHLPPRSRWSGASVRGASRKGGGNPWPVKGCPGDRPGEDQEHQLPDLSHTVAFGVSELVSQSISRPRRPEPAWQPGGEVAAERPAGPTGGPGAAGAARWARSLRPDDWANDAWTTHSHSESADGREARMSPRGAMNDPWH